MKKEYTVYAKSVINYTTTVVANSESEAMEAAKKLRDGEWYECEGGGRIEVVDADYFGDGIE